MKWERDILWGLSLVIARDIRPARTYRERNAESLFEFCWEKMRHDHRSSSWYCVPRRPRNRSRMAIFSAKFSSSALAPSSSSVTTAHSASSDLAMYQSKIREIHAAEQTRVASHLSLSGPSCCSRPSSSESAETTTDLLASRVDAGPERFHGSTSTYRRIPANHPFAIPQNASARPQPRPR
jgi:hypothetical protein